MTPPRLIFTLLALAFAAALRAQTSLPTGGAVLLKDDALASFRLSSSQGNDAATVAAVEATGVPFAQACRIETQRDLSPAWAVEFRSPLPAAAATGDVALVHFFARSPAAADESGRARLRVVVQKTSADYNKDLDTEVSIGREWQEFFLPFAFAHMRGAGEAEFSFGVGFKRQTIEVGGVELLNYGRQLPLSALPKTRFSYPGREPDAAWRRAALARIEELRKGDFALRVTDAAGAPIAGATVRVEQRRSAFQWGSALQLARLVHDSPENQTYRAKVLELFNAASPENDLKWPAWNGDRGPGFSHEQSLAALRWLDEHRFSTRGHVLVWPGWKDLPKNIVERRDTPHQKEIPELVLAHIRDETTATKDLIREWDVLNEPYDHHDLMAIFGNDIMTAWFKAAAESVPGVPLYLNDYSNHDMVADAEHFKNFSRNVIFLQKAGAPLGGLGLQGHIGASPNAPANILATLDLLSEFKLPIRFTEFDIDTDDEQLQADYTRDFLILAFSHPAVVGVQHWGFWEKAHWRPRAAMFRPDWSEKPNAKVYRDLVLDQWRTKAAGETDADGKFSVRGFHGEYAIYVEKDGRKAQGAFVLRPNANP
jgi:GH35 family endo-1,4-beta-xylanase